ncbi:hypothetical protein [Halomonas sp. LC1]|uniref:hypothetical protein n=1 Tax=Halomonas sp. LC1 TaxID=3043733 RepID=UPI0025531D72|nr:hypothetical protein [Halomonas sp. LC1]MDK9687990.1 hypothetical protein [Halomonas sp. LC1]
MTPEVTRRHYLDAMGITSWASRYQLPNALPTGACEWEDAPAKAAPRERLQALLDDAPAPRPPRQADAEPNAPSVTSPSAVKALLGQAVTAPQPEAAPAPEPAAPPRERAKPLNFRLSCVCLGGRWLSLCEGTLSVVEQQLLANILRAAGIWRGELPTVTHFTWPPMATAFEPEEPLEEAQEGVAAFIAGAASRQGWQLEQVLWWGAETASPDLARVIALNEGQSQTLALPVWQGPLLAALIQNASAKRALWPHLVALGKQWGKV